MISSTVASGCQQKLRQFIRRHEMLLGGESVLVAVSGGIDSMSLLDLLARVAPVLKLQIAVAHFDHELRGEASRDDANFVTEQARVRGLKIYVGRADVKRLAVERKLSVEDAARKARYQFLERIARRHDYSVVMTGHSADDNAETVVLNLLRGSGVTGLAAIPPVRPFCKGVVIARPLLWASRKEIEEYAGAVGVEWREDETNVSPRFLRNRVRTELLPLLREYNPAIVDTLNATAGIMRGVEQFVGHSVKAAAKRVVVNRSADSIELNANQLKHYLPAIQSELVQYIISKNFDLPPISYGAVDRALSLLWKESGSKAEILGGISVVRDRETLQVRRDPPPPIPVEKDFEQGGTVELGKSRIVTRRIPNEGVQFSNKRHIEYLDADKLSQGLVLRSWRDGDRFQPLGMEGEKKLSDFLVDVKVPLDKKRDVLVVVDGDRIVWVCGMRIDERFKIGPDTKNVLRLELHNLGGGRQGEGGGRRENDRGRGRDRDREPSGETQAQPTERGREKESTPDTSQQGGRRQKGHDRNRDRGRDAAPEGAPSKGGRPGRGERGPEAAQQPLSGEQRPEQRPDKRGEPRQDRDESGASGREGRGDGRRRDGRRDGGRGDGRRQEQERRVEGAPQADQPGRTPAPGDHERQQGAPRSEESRRGSNHRSSPVPPRSEERAPAGERERAPEGQRVPAPPRDRRDERPDQRGPRPDDRGRPPQGRPEQPGAGESPRPEREGRPEPRRERPPQGRSDEHPEQGRGPDQGRRPDPRRSEPSAPRDNGRGAARPEPRPEPRSEPRSGSRPDERAGRSEPPRNPRPERPARAPQPRQGEREGRPPIEVKETPRAEHPPQPSPAPPRERAPEAGAPPAEKGAPKPRRSSAPGRGTKGAATSDTGAPAQSEARRAPEGKSVPPTAEPAKTPAPRRARPQKKSPPGPSRPTESPEG